MRRALAVCVLSALALAPHASAAPAAGAEDGAGAQFTVTAAGHSYLVRVLASRPTAAATGTGPLVRVHVLESDVKLAGVPSALSLGTGTASLRTALGGVPLTITWAAEQYVVAASFGEAGTDTSSSSGWLVAGSGAVARVTLGGIRCTTDSAVLGTATTHDTDSYGAPLARGLGLRLKGARCTAPVSAPFPPPLP